MFPPGPFDTPSPSFQYPVPPPAHSPDAQIDCVRVSFSSAWLPYIIGSLKQLWLASTWIGDDTVKNNLQDQALNLISLFMQAETCPRSVVSLGGIVSNEDEMAQIRVDCDCNVFVMCCDGTEVQLMTSKNSVSQPAAGSKVPAGGGGTAEYCGRINANETWLLPVNVSAGDTLLFSDLGGAWNDGSTLAWQCPNGFSYFAGACFFAVPLGSPDPMPAVRHMQIIADIAGTFRDVLNTTITGAPQVYTVPAGVSNAQVLIRGNSSTLAGASGEVSFCIAVTNNQPEFWTQELDFTASGLGFSPCVFTPSFDNAAVYSPGVGWAGVNPPHAPTTTYDAFARAILFRATQITVYGTCASANQFEINDGTPTSPIPATLLGPLSESGDFVETWNGDYTFIDGLRIDCNDTTTPSGSPVIRKIVIRGIGANPFV